MSFIIGHRVGPCVSVHLWTLFAASGFVILTGQTFEAEPAPEHSELIILTSYGVFRTLLPAGRAPLQGQRIPLLRVFVAFGGLESV